MTDHEHVYQIIRNTVRESVWRHSGNTDLAATVADDVLITCRAGLGPTLDTDGVNVATHYLRSRHPELQSNREGDR